MNATEWLNELEKKADAATPGPWEYAHKAMNDDMGVSFYILDKEDQRFAYIPPMTIEEHDGDYKAQEAAAAFIAAANPETVKKLVEMIRELTEAVADPCYTCSWENETREEECPKGCHVAMTLKKYGVVIPRNLEMEVFG